MISNFSRLANLLAKGELAQRKNRPKKVQLGTYLQNASTLAARACESIRKAPDYDPDRKSVV